ncbi:hypothetical protein SARC_00519 [Sphaeroforma arctica JP610]|uniref:UEV domain-containing protein n=1 Tax=Sphaeroforma arctica JP610 TaxID=667725 RepID=A0A0L0GGD4_9EUKA|nr:hypothetical protein SARC_00519 [Sphaeroforma arctica JP610]KNC87378.1 hypothetical protein SARC_00519 [Sphaeroforma arctica JP610]|eukprot:XP_014161280.1 hypothetical protein SARC_00519 [Sphaeroforma arctica JP610]
MLNPQDAQYVNSQLQMLGYKNHRDVSDDVCRTLTEYPSLKPKTELYTTNDGRSRQLLNLSGTLPIDYRGSRYNIPVVVWLLDVHPEIPPVVFVVPTANMLVKAGQHVDNDGLVYHPYLSSWARGSTLSGLMYYCREVFSLSPPVYARPQNQPSVQRNQSMPPNHGGYGGASSYAAAQPPAGFAAQPPGGFGGYGPPSNFGPPANFGRTLSTSEMATGFKPPASITPPAMPVRPPDIYSATQQQQSAQHKQQPNEQNEVDNAIHDDVLLMSLRSAVADRLSREVPLIDSENSTVMNHELESSSTLSSSSRKLESMLEYITSEEYRIDTQLKEYTRKTAEIKKSLVTMKESEGEEQDLESMTRPKYALYNQLIDAVAKHHAVEDVVYYLGKRLYRKDADDDIFTLDKYMKYIRQLFREEFHHRSTIKVARKEAGLPEYI